MSGSIIQVFEGCWLPAETDEMDNDQAEEVLLDENSEAARFDFYMVGGLEHSPDHKLVAYAEDTSGNEKYTLHVKDIHNDREMLKEPIKVSWTVTGWTCTQSCTCKFVVQIRALG